MQGLSYCAHEVYAHDRDLFLRSLFVPIEEREALLTAYALIVELDNIRAHVSEEMIGHIRHAWWQESIEALYTNHPPHGQPVLEALYPLITSGQLPQTALMPLLNDYRDHYPNPPPDRDALIQTLSQNILKPASQSAWNKADRLILRQRQRYGKRLYPWLMLKLLLA